MRTTWNFHAADWIHFGSGASGNLGRIANLRNIEKTLVVADTRLTDAGVVGQVTESLANESIGFDVFDGGAPEPSLEVADAACAAASASNPQAILGLGGGSNMDLAKVTAVVQTYGGKPSDYFGWDQVPGPVLPLICVPTTAGTGSEVSHAAVLTDTANAMKVSTLSNFLRPMLAVVDPRLTLTCPPKATADSGIDALTHAIEAYTATDSTALDVPEGEFYPYDGRHPLGECLAEKAIELIGRHLVTAVREPDNLAAREGMALAALLAGMAFSNCGVAVVHALEYPLGGSLHCSHGAGNGLLLPFVMKFNLPERTPALARIAALLGEDVDGLSQEAAAERAIASVERLKEEIGIPLRIRDLGGTEDQLPEFAAKAFSIERLMLLNGRRPSEADLLGILQDAF